MNNRIASILLLIVLPSTAAGQLVMMPDPSDNAQGPVVLYPAWGTAQQCEAHRAGDNADFQLFPYVIDHEWIQHGVIWCRLSWQGYESGELHTRARALARCGEDTVRDYVVFFDLQDGVLEMSWSRDFRTGRLQRC